jgi:hypothetical protein
MPVDVRRRDAEDMQRKAQFLCVLRILGGEEQFCPGSIFFSE